MSASRGAYLIPAILLLAACAAGTTMRVAQDEESDAEPVALAPEPEPAPDSAETEPFNPAPPQEASPDTLTQPPSQGYAPYGGSTTPEVRRVGQWTRTGIAEARRLVIRDANAWAEFWSELGVGERPEVDFSRDLVIAVAAGQRPTGGHGIAVQEVRQSNGALAIKVVEIVPGPNCMTTTSLTQPVDVVVVSGVNARGWSFVEQKEVRGCR